MFIDIDFDNGDTFATEWFAVVLALSFSAQEIVLEFGISGSDRSRPIQIYRTVDRILLLSKEMVMKSPVKYLSYPVRITAKHPPQGVDNIEIPPGGKLVSCAIPLASKVYASWI